MQTKKYTVLVIEDEPLLLQAISKKFQKTDLDVVTATTAKQGLDYLKNLPELPSAIWLDYYLKDSNGIEFMTKMKANKNWAKIPVVVVSNSASDEKVHSLLALGVKQYLLKAEYRLDEIVDIVKKFIKEEK